MANEKELVILDTDTGIDDAMALLQFIAAKKSGKVELLCITAVKGNCSCENALRNICRVMDTVGVHDVPVYKGATKPLVVPFEGEYYHGMDGFNDVKFESEPDMSRVKEEKAWDVISNLSRKYPNRISLVAIGPLTNVAMAFNTDPDLPNRLKEIFIMGGNIEGMGNSSAAAEFNFHADPEAAYVTLSMTRCPTYIASWELCLKYVKLTRTWRSEKLEVMKKPAADLINRLEQVWFDAEWRWGEHWILCDQLAATAFLHRNSIKRSTPHYAQIVLEGITRGMMLLDQRRGVDKVDNVIIIDEMDESVIQDSLYEAFNQ